MVFTLCRKWWFNRIKQNFKKNDKMRKYNFDEIIDRRGTDCIKYDALPQFFGADGLLPVWVADMDFRTPDFVMNAVRKRLEHEILGYTFRGDSYHEAIQGWLKRRHNWEVRREWISFSPGVVSALTMAVMAFTQPGEKVVVQPPVYFPFYESVRGSKRRIVENPLKLVDGRYCFDLEDLEQKIDDQTKMLLLCSPHNPGGMVWSRTELEALYDVCASRNVLVVSDEIHADLLYPGQVHTPFAAVSEKAAQNSIVCMAPSKTFNLAGLSTSFVVIPNPELMKEYERLLRTLHVNMGNIPGAVALEAAYTSGDDWLNQLMEYVEGNYRFLENFFLENLPEVKVMKPEATFLVWLDFRAYGMKDKELNRFIVEKARVGLNNGGRFGTGGDGFMRINLGCPRSVLAEALTRLKNAFQAL